MTRDKAAKFRGDGYRIAYLAAGYTPLWWVLVGIKHSIAQHREHMLFPSWDWTRMFELEYVFGNIVVNRDDLAAALAGGW